MPRTAIGELRGRAYGYLQGNMAHWPQVKVVLGQFAHAGFVFDTRFPRIYRLLGAERAQRRARARNRAKWVGGGMCVISS